MKHFFFGALALTALVGCGKTEPTLSARSFSERSTGCETGIKSFEKTVHPLLRSDCVGCHDTGGIGPAHSIGDVAKSYGRILGYMNWASPETSRFVEKGGNRHCMEHPGGNCKSTYDDIKRVVKAWWDEGQKDCPTIGKFVTRPVAVPNLPKVGETFTTMKWPLASIDPIYTGAYLEVEVRRLARRGTEYYLFRKPRVFTPTKSLKIGDIHFLVNGKYDPFAANFSLIKAAISPPIGLEMERPVKPLPVLSTSTVLVAQDRPEGDEISLTFEELRVIAEPRCKSVESFKAKVLPAFQMRKCYNCHAGGPEKLKGREPANQMFNMALSEDKLCESALQRVSGRYLTDSPLIAYPLKGTLGHPRVFLSGEEIFPDWLEWIREEKN